MKSKKLKNQLENIKRSKTAEDIERQKQEQEKIEIMEMTAEEFKNLKN